MVTDQTDTQHRDSRTRTAPTVIATVPATVTATAVPMVCAGKQAKVKAIFASAKA